MEALPYIRLSDKDQSSYSIDNQRREISNYCKKYGLTESRPFIDNGESSYTFDRADFKQMEIYIKKFKPQFIIVLHLDRFSRNLAEALQKIRELLSKHNVRVRDITEPLDLDDNDPNVFLMRSFRFMMAESELHRIRQRIKQGMVQGAMSGRHLNMAPYGYKNGRDDQDKPLLIINEDKAFHVQLIYKEYLAGNTIEDVRKIVKLLGYSQKSNSAVQRILSNPVYIGKIKVPGSEKLAQGLHKPIISEYDFYKAQEILTGRRTITHQAKEEVYLRGVLKDYNGQLMTAGNSRGKSGQYYWYYVSKTTRQNYSAKKLHDQFIQLLEMLSFSKKELDWFVKKLKASIEEKLSLQTEVAKKITNKLADVHNRIERAEEKYLGESEVSGATYKKVINKLRAEQSDLTYKLISNNTDSPKLLDKLNKLLPFLANLPELFVQLPLGRQQQFIRTVFDNSLAYYNECYRTPYLHPIFEPKALLLNENRLLIVEQPVIKMGETPVRTENGSTIELLEELFKVLAA